MLQKISKEELLIYRTIYKINWPKYITSYGLFNFYIERFEKHPEWEHKVDFFKLKDEPINYGTFVFFYGNQIYFDTLETAPYEKLDRLLNQLDYSEEKTFINIRDNFRPLLKDLLRVQYLEKTFETGTKCFYSEPVWEINEDFIESLTPEGFYFDTVKECHAEQIDSVWPQRHINSLELMKTAIRYNPSLGIFRKSDGRMVGWTVVLETGVSGHLFIEEEYLRQGFATILGMAHAIKMKELNKPVYGNVVHQNYKSFNMNMKYVKAGNSTWVCNNTWIGTKKRTPTELSPLWGHL